MNKPTVFIIILNWNAYQLTLDCFFTIQLMNRTGCNIRVVVVDNASTADYDLKYIDRFNGFHFSLINYKKIPKSKLIKTELLKNSQNLGYAGGNNAGIRYAMDNGADYILILNNDTNVDSNLLIELLQAAKSHPKGGIFAPKIYFFPGGEFHKDRYTKSDRGNVIWAAGGEIDWQNIYGVNRGLDQVDTGQFNNLEQVDMVSGCCILLTKQAIQKLQGFDDRYFLYYEDVDLSIRAKKLGLEIWYVPTAKLWHRNAGSSGVGSNLHDYFISRNRMLIGMQFAPLRTKLALIRESVRLLFSGRLWQRKGIIDFYLQKFGQGSYQP